MCFRLAVTGYRYQTDHAMNKEGVDAIGEWLTSTFGLGVMLCASVFATCLLAYRIWFTRQPDSLPARCGWTLVILIPLVGWVLYLGRAHLPSFVSSSASRPHPKDSP